MSAVLPAYAELHCLSNFTFLRGASHPEELVERAAADWLRGARDHRRVLARGRGARAHRGQGIPLKLLIGAEFRLDRRHASSCCSRPIAKLRRSVAADHHARRRSDERQLSARLAPMSSRGVGGCLVLWIPATAGSDARSGAALSLAAFRAAWIAVELLCGPTTARSSSACMT